MAGQSDQQFLTGDANGKQVTVAGQFRIAQGTGKLPVVVLIQGSSGVGAGMDPWVRHLNTMGISTFVIDAIRIFHGTPDDYNPVASCKAYLARLQEARRDAVLTEYPDSAHGFDAGLLGLSTVAVSANAQSARDCRLKEGEGGVLMNTDTQAPFTYKDACIALNPHVGGNPATAVEARKAVSDFLQALLRL